MDVREQLIQITSNPKVAATVSAATTSTGLGTVLDLIPDDIGKLATLAGIILSSVLIYTHWRYHRIKYKTAQLEYNALKAKESERLDRTKLRETDGLPIRRSEDSEA